MSKQTANDITKAVSRRSLLIADNLALDLSVEDLEYIFQSIGLAWLTERLYPGLKVGDVLRIYFPDELEQDKPIDRTPDLKDLVWQAVEHAIEIKKEYLLNG